MNLIVADYFFTLLHLLIIGVNLFAWIWVKTRRIHLYFVGATLFCWIILGIWYGFGYCPITDWQWQIKTKLGDQNLPNSFVKYLLDEVTDQNFSHTTIEILTLGSFLVAISCSIKLNFFQKQVG